MKSKKKTLCELMMIILSISLVSCSGGESSKNSVYTNDTTSSIKTSDTGGSDSNSIIMNGYIYSNGNGGGFGPNLGRY